MLRSRCSRSLQEVLRRRLDIAYFSSSSAVFSHQPNAPLELDPSFQTLLRDVDISILKHKPRHPNAEVIQPRVPRELEEYSNPDLDTAYERSLTELESEEGYSDPRETRKSPAALFGSQQIGSVVMPFELQQTITRLIRESDKPTLHTDAARLFLDDTGEDAAWDASYDVKYKSRRQAHRHAERDGTAFASVALPSHYSAVYAVLNHVKQRLGPGWSIDRVIDWGCGTGTGLWATSHSFQKEVQLELLPSVDDAQLSSSSVSTYLGIDKREGLVSIGKRLLKDVDMGGLSVSWQKSFHEDDKIHRAEGGDVLALSAFMLSSIPTTLARKALVKEMWDSGAGMIIIIDHNSRAGFECIAEAREFLLRMGKKELEDPETEGWEVRGSHVVAPCPHDGACPLYHPGSSKLVCGFSQRLQRPDFVRKTKHSGVGHEDSGYSYVVIRRGSRPAAATTKVGRIGDVGKRASAASVSQRPMQELLAHGEHADAVLPYPDAEDTSTSPSQAAKVEDTSSQMSEVSLNAEVMQAALRLEAFSWPRLVFPPIKKSGHIILDACTAEAKLMRMTIPKSQGKQPFYDARKSSWGDIFPHEPKNPPQERYQPMRAKREGGTTPTKGEDIGKRKTYPSSDKASYGKLSEDIKDQKEKSRRERRRSKDDLWMT
ncbi:Rsm22-cox11 tandem protein 2, mitochondrial [Sparassis crispa]|uniref:Rsm22-cox11 tandem protein 2, mitochondrial n=1 Tax=Sparassis crispa TaxID=139825 RepID=A0A401G5N7_9APHY|nr:Rsm22-cox11 tandem protein 2, mitochondrial [Sparassis crispa]GBE77480.1 Rsm22-cox11 tandem protein 2, mitochondrial [Sparassis crispa]